MKSKQSEEIMKEMTEENPSSNGSVASLHEINKADTDVVVPRTIGLMGGISFIVGTIIGSGIFVSPRGLAEGSGSVGLTMISWVMCGIVSMLGALCFAELGTVIKDSGADYSYLHAGFGPIVSYMFSWVNNILVRPASLGLITLTCAEYIMTPLFDDGCGGAPEHIKKILAIVFLFILAAVNVYSVTLAKRVQIIFTVSKLIALTIVIVGGIVKLCQGYTTHLSTGFEGTETNPGTVALGLYSGMWAYDGWNTANFMTEEMINPKRNLPLAICIGVPLVIVAYILTNISYFTVMSVQDVTSSAAVAITWANRVIPNAAWIIPIFVALSTFGTGNGSLFSGGSNTVLPACFLRNASIAVDALSYGRKFEFSSYKLMYTSARNEHLPEILAMVHHEKYTPVPAIALSIVLAIVFLIPADIGTLIDFIAFLMWIFYGLAFLTVIIFRFKKPYKDIERSFKVNLIIPVLAFLASLFIIIAPIVADPQIEFLYAVGLIVIGYIIYVPLVYFRFRFKFMEHVTTFFQLNFQCVKAKQALE